MIRLLLLHRIEDTDRHGGLMLALAVLVMCAALCFAPELPQ
jgi:hypothetical protein